MTSHAQPSWVRRIDRTGYPLIFARLVLGGMFIYLGCMKLQDPTGFLKQVKLYGILPLDPPHWLNLTAVALPWLEVISGVALLLGVFIRGSAVVLGAMLLVFIPALFSRAMDIHEAKGIPFCAVKFDCGCGTGPRIICVKIAENVGLTVLALVALLSHSRRLCLSSLFARRRGVRGRCSKCGHDLRGLPEARCPECSTPFAAQAPATAPKT